MIILDHHSLEIKGWDDLGSRKLLIYHGFMLPFPEVIIKHNNFHSSIGHGDLSYVALDLILMPGTFICVSYI